jgi:uncharacterized membrane protein YqgA involved in biofilm formation
VIGTLVNAAAIVAGGSAGLVTRGELPVYHQKRLKLVLGVFLVFAGLSQVWHAANGGVRRVLLLFVAVFGALVLGRFLGGRLGVQRFLNRFGRFAKERIAAAPAAGPPRFSVGFTVCAALFCLEPLAVLGAVPDGLTGDYRPLLLKSVMDGLTAMALARTLGWGVLVSALPVFALQGTLWLGTRGLAPWLEQRQLVDAISAADGLLVFSVALVVLQLRRLPLADYLPSLVLAPVLAWLLR